MQLPIYQVDAFANKIFSGNPAAVVPLEQWLSVALMQQIAEENNLAETAFFVFNNGAFDLRWFTPTMEVPLCGHATMAAAHVIFNELDYKETVINFNTASGLIKVAKLKDDQLAMHFPAMEVSLINNQSLVNDCFNMLPVSIYESGIYTMAVFNNEQEIASLVPNIQAMLQKETMAIIATSKGANSDFVCRFFAPKMGVNEDPVTGSAFSRLVPYWSKELQKFDLVGIQISTRRGVVHCNYTNNELVLTGTNQLYLKGVISV
jgi:PhzF family phenazine biosynthesis protein